MTHDELREELQGLADSTDEHVTADNAVVVLELLVERIEQEGLGPEPHVAEEADRG